MRWLVPIMMMGCSVSEVESPGEVDAIGDNTHGGCTVEISTDLDADGDVDWVELEYLDPAGQVVEVYSVDPGTDELCAKLFQRDLQGHVVWSETQCRGQIVQTANQLTYDAESRLIAQVSQTTEWYGSDSTPSEWTVATQWGWTDGFVVEEWVDHGADGVYDAAVRYERDSDGQLLAEVRTEDGRTTERISYASEGALVVERLTERVDFEGVLSLAGIDRYAYDVDGRNVRTSGYDEVGNAVTLLQTQYSKNETVQRSSQQGRLQWTRTTATSGCGERPVADLAP